MNVGRREWALLLLAVVLLDASVTFENVWPTPAITLTGRPSIELAVVLLLVAAGAAKGRVLAARGLRLLSVAWLALVLGRYGEVTAPALYGRDVNLYWDLRFVPDVVSMMTRVAPVWLLLAGAVAAAAALTLVYAAIRWSFTRIARGAADRYQRRAVVAFGAATLLLATYASPPVTRTYVRQARLLADALRGSKTLPPSPVMDDDFSRIRGADVFLIFVEAYGAASFDRPDIAARLVRARSELEAAIRSTGRESASAYVESPTFGGSSWLAHISLMSGIDVRQPDTNARLMMQRRDTLVRAFGRAGFRTVALMPGLRQRWPEGVFYGFDEIYGAERLAYRGPEFGWFAIPDQYSLERLDALEVARAPRAPLFVFFPTISTHFPFSPTPPYQPDWRRVNTEKPFDGADLVRAYSRQPEWTDFSDGYADAIAYDLETIAGYLRVRKDRDFVVVVVGDHQPAAAVSGEGASWDVPVHVVASRRIVIDSLLERGFRPGLTPSRPRLARMHELLPVLLDAFGDRRRG